ncbi:NHL repeat-containing protein 2 [Hordeum vulgare]|nr:NHL repeat-containing protein 2 [Hordeum vulgare]
MVLMYLVRVTTSSRQTRKPPMKVAKDSLSRKKKHEVAALDAAWQSCHERWIEIGLPAGLPKVFDVEEDDTAMETGYDDTSRLPHLMCSPGYTMT